MYLALPPQCIVIIYSQISKRTMSPGKHSHCGYAIKTSFVITHRTTNFKRRRRISSEVQLPRLSTLKSTTYPAFVHFTKDSEWWLSLNFMSIIVQFSNTYILLNGLTLSFLILQSLCIKFTIDGYYLCLMLCSHKSRNDITIIQEVCSILNLK